MGLSKLAYNLKAVRQTKFVVKARYYSSVSLIYALTLLFGVYIFAPFKSQHAAATAPITIKVPRPSAPKINVIAGLPTRIVIPSIKVDLLIDKGYYDKASDSWTLSSYHAQYATISTPANNYQGSTFIYGHNNEYVFGLLRIMNLGDQAYVYTDNGLMFTYTYQSSKDYNPTDTSVLGYSGPPRLTVQTCGGSMLEFRQMFIFNFDKVEPVQQ